LIDEIEEEYTLNKYTLLNMSKEEFNQMEPWEQQIAMRNFLIGSEFATENMRKQFQAKYKELLGSSLEKQGQMFDDDNLDERLKNDQQLIRGKPQPETFPPEGASKTRYEPKENIYRERPSSPISDDEDFKLASRNVGEWLKNQAKTPPERPSSPVKEFINKNVINPLFRRHSRNSSTTSLPQIPSKLKNEVNPEEDEEEFKLQNPPISRLKREKSITSTTSNQSSNTDKWRKNREIRRKMFEESKKEDITSDDERNMEELDSIIEDDTKDYYENQYNNQDEMGESSKQQRHEDIDMRIIEIP